MDCKCLGLWQGNFLRVSVCVVLSDFRERASTVRNRFAESNYSTVVVWATFTVN